VQLLFVFVKLDNREAQEAADNLLDEISFIREDEPDLSSGGICLTRPTGKAQKRAANDLLDRSTGQENTTMEEVQQVARDKFTTLIGQETKVVPRFPCHDCFKIGFLHHWLCVGFSIIHFCIQFI
jgi:hypothetical protein